MRCLGKGIEWSAGPVGLQRGGTIPRTRAVPEDKSRRQLTREPALPDVSTAGRALVTRRAVIDIVRSVTLGSYGVAGFGGGIGEQIVGALERRPAGIRVSIRDGEIAIGLHLRVAHGLPIAEVARQVDSAIRYAIRRALARHVDRLTIRIAGLEAHPGGEPPAPPAGHSGIGASELADSGTDVA
jgi:uncharacterized alkaline shock family protein YloU